jgi:hypothetical protein
MPYNSNSSFNGIYASLMQDTLKELTANERLFKSLALKPEIGYAQSWQEQFRSVAGSGSTVKSLAQPNVESGLSQIRDCLQPIRSARMNCDIGVELKAIFSAASTATKFFETTQASIKSILATYEISKITALEICEAQALIGKNTALSSSRISETLSELRRPVIASLSSLSSLSSISAKVWKDLSEEQANLQVLPRLLLEAPVIQTYEASRSVVQIVSAEIETEVEPEESEEPIVFYSVERSTLVERLEALGQEFADAFLGAKEAIISKRPDYVRHASTSLRELLGKLLEHLVPDDFIQDWPEGTELLKQKETRKARLRYLFRGVNSSSYAVFVEKDIDVILQTFHALNKGTHSLKRPFTDLETSILVTRVEGHLLMLLTAANR